jgi:hypothetical protein
MITLRTLKYATDQDVFDQVVEHLMAQQKQCMADNRTNCAYRNSNGEKCAAGCLISDEEYRSTLFEGRGWRTHVKNRMVPYEHCWLIGMLQSIHDNYNPVDWPRELRDLAEMHKLSTEVLEKYK